MLCLVHQLTGRSRKILEYQFPKVPSVYVRLIVVRNKTLSEAFAALDASERTFATTEAPGYQQLRKERKAITDTELFAMLPIVGPERNQLIQELMAAREKRRNENGTVFASRSVTDTCFIHC